MEDNALETDEEDAERTVMVTLKSELADDKELDTELDDANTSALALL